MELTAVFRSYDENGDGKISAEELMRCLAIAGDESSLEEATALLESADADGDGLLDLEEFEELLAAAGGEEDEGETGRDLRTAFGMYESDGEGCITAGSLKRMLSRLGTPRPLDDCRAMIRRFDLDGDGVISFEEFKAMVVA